jgi:hypothetical protein
MSDYHTRAIAKNLMEDPHIDFMAIRGWLTQEQGPVPVTNLKEVVVQLAAHPDDQTAVEAAKQLQSAVCGTPLGSFDVVEMIQERQIFSDAHLVEDAIEDEPVLVEDAIEDEPVLVKHPFEGMVLVALPAVDEWVLCD